MRRSPFFHAPLVASLAALVLALAGCHHKASSTPDGGTQKATCDNRDGCSGGQICTTDGYCSDCVSSGQCRLKEECKQDLDAGTQRCALREGWGTDCQKNEECQAGQWCMQGLCKDSSEVRLCAGGTNDECLTGQRCNIVNLVCEEDLGCAFDSDCSPAEACNVGSHACVPRCTQDTVSTVCAPGEKCYRDICVQCSEDADCGAGLVCDAAGKCGSAPRCYQDRDCTVPLVCYIPTGACVSKPPPCVSDENCPNDQRCNVSTGKCVPKDCQPDAQEPNNDLAHATPATASQLTGLTLCLNDIDIYALSLARGDQLGVNVDADPFAESTFTTVIEDSSGRTLAAGRLLASYVAPAADTYYVSISSTDPFQIYDVRFLLSHQTPCDDDSFEPNDQPSQAVPLNSAGQVDGVVCPQDHDYFSVTVPASSGLSAKLVNYDSSGGLLTLCVLDGSTVLGCSDDASLPQVQLSASQAQGKTLLLRVDAADARAQNSYTLQVDFP